MVWLQVDFVRTAIWCIQLAGLQSAAVQLNMQIDNIHPSSSISSSVLKQRKRLKELLVDDVKLQKRLGKIEKGLVNA